MTRPPASLRRRLLAATVMVLALALLPAGGLLGSLFREHATEQFRTALQVQLDQLVANTRFDATGAPVVDQERLTDPRFTRPFSGLYWQVDGPGQPGLLRSRSLWDQQLALPHDELRPGVVHVHAGQGPQGEPLLQLERTIHSLGQPEQPWRLVVAAGTGPLEAAVARFRNLLALSLAALFLLLALASWVQVTVGLAPLATLRQALEAWRARRSGRLEGRFPLEVQPLVDELNGLLEENAAMVERSRQQAGNLAHALKTPLAVLQQVAEQLERSKDGAANPVLARLLQEQVAQARRQVDWHLARARADAQRRAGAGPTPLAPALQKLVRLMERVHAERGVRITLDPPAPQLAFAGDERDLLEMAGNLVDNACKWARGLVRLRAEAAGQGKLALAIEDDGPGIAADRLPSLPARGRRLDETTPGSGLGLAIVQDLAAACGGELVLARSEELGGLRAQLDLPAA